MAYSNVAAGDVILASTINDLIAQGLNKPTVRLVQAVAQSIADNTLTAITYTTEDIDTHSFHSTTSNTSRITPTVPGLYAFRAMYFSGAPTTLVSLDGSLRKNGSTQIAGAGRGNAGALGQSQPAFAVVECNGTTDYVEHMALQDSAGATNTSISLRFTSMFECWLLRGPL